MEANGTAMVSGCGCKGIRVCALCESSERAMKLRKTERDLLSYATYVYVCPVTKTAVKIQPNDAKAPCPSQTLFEIQRNHHSTEDEQERLYCDNVILVTEFLTEEEEAELVEKIDRQPWMPSQSGRRKQDYGPRVNFKEKKVKLDRFIGMPSYSSDLLDKMALCCSDGALGDYTPLELCNLEYDPNRQSAIDFHIDDTWIWGDRLISVNLLAGSIMTLIDEPGHRLVYVPMPRGSLLCMAGHMRYEWTHGIFPHHVQHRRIGLTMREASGTFRAGGDLYEKWGRTLQQRSRMIISG